MVYLTSRAGERLGERADVYEWGRVTALVGTPLGAFHAGAKSSACRGKNICSEELVNYLREKYGVPVGGKLSVWSAEDDSVLFLGLNVTREEADCRFDERFEKVALDYRKRYGEWVFIEDNCVSFTAGVRQSLPRRLALWEDGESLALAGDPEGPYVLEYRGSRKGDAVYSGQLADYCKARFGCAERSLLLHAAAAENGVRFALREETLRRRDRTRPPVRVNLGLPRDSFVRTLNQKSIYVSSKGAKRLGGKLNVYTAGGFLALRGESSGALTLRETQYQHFVHSEALCREIEKRYPGCGKLYLCEHGDLLALVADDRAPGQLPSPERFRRLSLPVRRRRPAPAGAGSWTEQNAVHPAARTLHQDGG